MNKLFKFFYLNTYSFLLLLCGIIILLFPFFRLNKLLIILQVTISFVFFYHSMRLFSTYKDKLKKCDILIKKNFKEFKPESFKVFMQAPCGRLVTKTVLKELGKIDKYKSLLIYKESLLISAKNNCKHSKTSIYINEDFR